MPVGTILPYAGNLADIPLKWALCDGTNGTPDLRDRFLESYGTFTVGQLIDPGLPNIKGYFRARYSAVVEVDNSLLSFRDTGIRGDTADTGNGNVPAYLVDFNASASNPIYGRSNTVQPAAYVVYYIMKIKK